jgi:hypothetical protein
MQVIALAGISQREYEPLHNPPRSSESASGQTEKNSLRANVGSRVGS